MVVAHQAAAGGGVVVAGQATRVRVVGSVGVESVGSLTLGMGVGHGAGGQRRLTDEVGCGASGGLVMW